MIKGICLLLILLIGNPAFAQLISREDIKEPGFQQNDGFIIDFQSRRRVARQAVHCCNDAVTFINRTEPPMVQHFVRMSLNADTHFDFNRSTLKPAGIAALNGLINRVAALDPGYGMGRIGYVTGVDAIGHTDWIGSNRYNDRLGSRRANTVRRYLMAHGVPGGFINTQSLGELQPVADNRSAQGRAQNRRVEIMVRTVTIPQ